MRIALITALAVRMAGCSTAPDCGPTEPAICTANRAFASTLTGTWTSQSGPNRILLRMTVSARDTTVSGTGTVTTPAGLTRAGRIDGGVYWRGEVRTPMGLMVAAPSAILTLTFADGGTARFDQVALSGKDTLRGGLAFSDGGPVTYGITLVRSTASLP